MNGLKFKREFYKSIYMFDYKIDVEIDRNDDLFYCRFFKILSGKSIDELKIQIYTCIKDEIDRMERLFNSLNGFSCEDFLKENSLGLEYMKELYDVSVKLCDFFGDFSGLKKNRCRELTEKKENNNGDKENIE